MAAERSIFNSARFDFPREQNRIADSPKMGTCCQNFLWGETYRFLLCFFGYAFILWKSSFTCSYFSPTADLVSYFVCLRSINSRFYRGASEMQVSIVRQRSREGREAFVRGGRRINVGRQCFRFKLKVCEKVLFTHFSRLPFPISARDPTSSPLALSDMPLTEPQFS